MDAEGGGKSGQRLCPLLLWIHFLHISSVALLLLSGRAWLSLPRVVVRFSTAADGRAVREHGLQLRMMAGFPSLSQPVASTPHAQPPGKQQRRACVRACVRSLARCALRMTEHRRTAALTQTPTLTRFYSAR